MFFILEMFVHTYKYIVGITYWNTSVINHRLHNCLLHVSFWSGQWSASGVFRSAWIRCQRRFWAFAQCDAQRGGERTFVNVSIRAGETQPTERGLGESVTRQAGDVTATKAEADWTQRQFEGQ